MTECIFRILHLASSPAGHLHVKGDLPLILIWAGRSVWAEDPDTKQVTLASHDQRSRGGYFLYFRTRYLSQEELLWLDSCCASRRIFSMSPLWMEEDEGTCSSPPARASSASSCTTSRVCRGWLSPSFPFPEAEEGGEGFGCIAGDPVLPLISSSTQDPEKFQYDIDLKSAHLWTWPTILTSPSRTVVNQNTHVIQTRTSAVRSLFVCFVHIFCNLLSYAKLKHVFLIWYSVVTTRIHPRGWITHLSSILNYWIKLFLWYFVVSPWPISSWECGSQMLGNINREVREKNIHHQNKKSLVLLLYCI